MERVADGNGNAPKAAPFPGRGERIRAGFMTGLTGDAGIDACCATSACSIDLCRCSSSIRRRKDAASASSDLRAVAAASGQVRAGASPRCAMLAPPSRWVMGSRLLRGLCWNSTRWEVGVGLEFRPLAARMVPSVFIALRGMPLVTTIRAIVVADWEVPERRGLSGGGSPGATAGECHQTGRHPVRARCAGAPFDVSND